MRIPVRLLSVLAVAVSVSIPPAEAAHHTPREGDVRFKVTCDYSHTSHDDPIVFPNQPHAAHEHDFFGNTGAVAATTTYASLRVSDTTCNHPGDEAAYWMPAMYAGAPPTKITPVNMTTYYRLGLKAPPIQAWAPGLRVVAGYNAADPEAAPTRWGWKCTRPGQDGRGTGPGFGNTPPASCPNDLVMAQVQFPDCWDGVNLDAADHRSHVAYSAPSGGGHHGCPASHPVPVPQITVDVNYQTAARPIVVSSGAHHSGGGVHLADPMTLHADFFDGWEPNALTERITTCLNGLRRCESGDGTRNRTR
jgi:hypothetical protein